MWLEEVVCYVQYTYYSNAKTYICKVIVVFLNLGVELLLRDNLAEPEAKSGKNAVPYHGSKTGENYKFSDIHAGKSCRNGYELSYRGDESTYKS